MKAIVQLALISSECGIGDRALEEFNGVISRCAQGNLKREYSDADPAILNKKNEEKSFTYFEAMAAKGCKKNSMDIFSSGFSIICRSDFPFDQQCKHDGFHPRPNDISDEDKLKRIWYLGRGEIW